MSTWILLRGLTRETRHWGRLPGLLSEATGTDRLLLLDLPGNGEFVRLRAPATVEDMVGFVRIAALQRARQVPIACWRCRSGAWWRPTGHNGIPARSSGSC